MKDLTLRALIFYNDCPCNCSCLLYSFVNMTEQVSKMAGNNQVRAESQARGMYLSHHTTPYTGSLRGRTSATICKHGERALVVRFIDHFRYV